MCYNPFNLALVYCIHPLIHFFAVHQWSATCAWGFGKHRTVNPRGSTLPYSPGPQASTRVAFSKSVWFGWRKGCMDCGSFCGFFLSFFLEFILRKSYLITCTCLLRTEREIWGRRQALSQRTAFLKDTNSAFLKGFELRYHQKSKTCVRTESENA